MRRRTFIALLRAAAKDAPDCTAQYFYCAAIKSELHFGNWRTYLQTVTCLVIDQGTSWLGRAGACSDCLRPCKDQSDV
jgi:hypothetical protein